MQESVWFANISQLLIFYGFIVITLVYLLRKYRDNYFYILIIFLFYPAIFAFLGKNFQDLYRILSLTFTIWVFFRRKALSIIKSGDRVLIIAFFLFSFFYFISALNNNDKWTIILSQYSRYIIVILLWFLIRIEIFKNFIDALKFSRLLFDLILMQIYISVSKILIFNNLQIESLVGSLSYIGGAIGTSLPILGFIVLWFHKKGILVPKDWIFILGLMLIGFTTGKRAIWFIMPVVISAFMVYVPRKKIKNSLLAAIVLAPFAFYLGVRLTPTLNPDNKVWGSFDFNYSFDYAEEYQFGDVDNKSILESSQGRGGATIFLLNNLISDVDLTKQDFFGLGLSPMYATDYGEFESFGLEISHKGSATGVFQTYITTGYFGVLTTILFFFYIISLTKNKRIKWVLLIILAWEYFMYTGIIFRTPALMALMIYFIHFSNRLYKQNLTLGNRIWNNITNPISE